MYAAKTFMAEVTFYSSARKTVPIADYHPHLVVENDPDKEYFLGIVFYDIEVDALDQEGLVMASCLYDEEGVGYHKLHSGAIFSVLEGPNIVGRGKVLAWNV